MKKNLILVTGGDGRFAKVLKQNNRKLNLVFVNKKQFTGNYYREHLLGVGDIEFQHVNNEVEHNDWLFTIKTKYQKELLKYLNNNKIMSRPFWMPMNQLPMYRDCHYISINDNCRVIHDNCLSIPCSTGISDTELDKVILTIKSFFKLCT